MNPLLLTPEEAFAMIGGRTKSWLQADRQRRPSFHQDRRLRRGRRPAPLYRLKGSYAQFTWCTHQPPRATSACVTPLNPTSPSNGRRCHSSDSLTALPIPLGHPVATGTHRFPQSIRCHQHSGKTSSESLAEETQTPPDLAGPLSIAMVATAAGGRVELQVPAELDRAYLPRGCSSPRCPPGARKTPVLAATRSAR